MDYEVVTTVVGFIISAFVGVVGYFLKKTMNRQDEFATKAELREIKEDIADMRATVEFIRENAISREDFFRNITEVKDDIKDLKDILMKK